MADNPSIIQLPEDIATFVMLDMREDHNFDKAFSSVKSYIDKIANSKEHLSEADVLPLRGVLYHYFKCMGYEDIRNESEIDELTERLLASIPKVMYRQKKSPFSLIRNVRNSIVSDIRGKEYSSLSDNSLNQAIMNVYNHVVSAYSQYSLNKSKRPTIESLGLGGFFNPNRSNKQRAKDLIRAAVKCIDLDDSLSEKAKQSIIQNLEKVVIELDKNNANWTEVFGKLKETIFVLGAVGSLIGGAAALSPLQQARQQLEEATKVIEETSIDINYETINNLLSNDGSFTVLPENFVIESSESQKLLPASSPSVGLEEEE